jgi:hypothetical protein
MSNFVNLLDIIYPVGSIYISTNATSPADSIGGTWTQIENCLLAASGDTYNVAGRFSGSNIISQLAIPDHQHNVVGWHHDREQYSGIGFWNTNAAAGNLWQLLSVGGKDGGDTGWNLWTKDIWRIDSNGQLVEQQKHIPYHYSLNVYKRTA